MALRLLRSRRMIRVIVVSDASTAGIILEAMQTVELDKYAGVDPLIV